MDENKRNNISIHAPRVGSDFCFVAQTSVWKYFNPRSPCGERRGNHGAVIYGRHFNPRSPCGERPVLFQHLCGIVGISIHAPRVGSDQEQRISHAKWHISIHAPRVGSDRERFNRFVVAPVFQSTLPVWGATILSNTFEHPTIFQSTLPVWGATRPCAVQTARPRGFQSTLPVWGATSAWLHHCISSQISIHAPRVGSDPTGWPQ